MFRFKNEDGASKIVIPPDPVHMTQSELHGLKFVIMYLHFLPASKKNVPMMLPDPIAIVRVRYVFYRVTHLTGENLLLT